MLKKPFFKILVFLCCSILVSVMNLPSAQAAAKGGVNGGGGSGIEALFKTRSLELSQTLLSFDEKSQSLLGFNPHDLFEALNDKEGFFVLCATDDKLEEIQKEKKMARVFNEVAGTVFLNCSDYTPKQWREKLDLNKVENAVFVLHEGLRILDMAGENNYGYSKNYIEALKNEEKVNFKRLSSAMNPSKEMKCYIAFYCREMLIVSNYCRAEFYYNGNSIFSKIYSTDIRDFTSQILNKSTAVGKEANTDLLATIKKANCD